MAKSELKRRVVTGAAISALLVVLVLIGGKPLVGVALLIAALIAWEFSSVVSSEKFSIRILSGIGAFLPALFTVIFTVLAPGVPATYGIMVSASLLLCAIVILSRSGGVDRELFFGPALAFMFPGTLSAALTQLCVVTNGGIPLLWFLFVVAGSDTAAYFGGKRFGGPKLAPELSPQKTISGSISGLFGAGLVSVLFSMFSQFHLSLAGMNPLVATLMIAVLLAVISQLGDLAGSSVKRMYGVKDYGSLLPGHGGVFDRVVAHAVAAPVFLLFL